MLLIRVAGRSSLFRVVVAIGSMASLSACGTATGPLPTPTIAPAKILTIGFPGSIQTLNPVTMVSNYETEASPFVWQGLLAVNSHGTPIPVLSRSVPSKANGLISSDGRAITFVLKHGLKWSDGAPLTAQDVKFGWRVATNRIGGLCPATCPSIRSVHVLSTTRVVFHLKYPFSPLLFGLPPVLPRHTIWQGDWPTTMQLLYRPQTDFLSDNWPVDGPFEVESIDGSTLALVRNPYWSALRTPAYEEVILEGISKDTNLIASQQSDPTINITQGYYDLDFIRKILSPSHLAGLNLHLYPIFGIEHLEPNLLGRVEPLGGKWINTRQLTDVRTRQALNLATDRRALLTEGLQIPPGQTKSLLAYGPEMPGRFDGIAVDGVWDPIQHRFGPSARWDTVPDANHFFPSPQLADAKKLLDAAGWKLRPDGFRYSSPTCDPAAPGCQLDLHLIAPHGDYARLQETLLLTRMWNSIGVNVIVDDRHWALGNLIAPFNERGPCTRGWDDMCLFAQLPGFDPQTDFQLEFTSNHVARRAKVPEADDINYPGIQSPLMDRIFARAPSVYNMSKRAALYRRWQVRVAKHVLWLPLFQRPMLVVIRGRIKNFDPTSRAVEWNPWALAPG